MPRCILAFNIWINLKKEGGNNTKKNTKTLLIIAVFAVLGITILTTNGKTETIDGSGGGSGLIGGGGNDSWIDQLLKQPQQEPVFENPFQMPASDVQFFRTDELAKSNGFLGENDPLFKAAVLETQLSAGMPNGYYQTSVPYAPTTTGAQAQIAAAQRNGTGNNTSMTNSPAPGSGGNRGGKGFGSARIVEAASKIGNTLPKIKKNAGSGMGTGGIGGGFGGGKGGAR